MSSVFQQMLPFLVEFIRCLPLICVAVICYSGGDEASITAGVISFFVLHFVLAFIAVKDTGKEHPKWLEKMAR